jgi:hypothetical protein
LFREDFFEPGLVPPERNVAGSANSKEAIKLLFGNPIAWDDDLGNRIFVQDALQ